MDSDNNDSLDDIFMDGFDFLSPPLEPTRRQNNDISMTNADLFSAETDDDEDDDDDFCLDLTATPQDTATNSGNLNDTIPRPGSATSNASTTQNSTNASPSPLDWLVDDGISEEQLIAMGIDVAEIRAQRELERQLELEAQQLAFARQLQDELNSQRDTSSSTSAPQTSSSVSNGKQPRRERQLPAYFESSNPNKRPKVENSQAESSSSGMTRTLSDMDCVYTIESDDDEIMDLTQETNPQAITLYDSDDHLPIYDLGEDEEDDDDDDIGILSDGAETERIMQQIMMIRRRQEAQDRYGITMNPLPRIPGLHYEHIGKNDNWRPPNIPFRAPSSTMSTQQATDELRQLLESINDEEPPPPESRAGTPSGLTVNLLEHQKVGFQWMSKQEASSNKGGMLTDDMGLGKTVQALAIIVSRRCQDAAELPDPMRISIKRSKRRMEPFKAKTTLVICPVSLMEQWAQEIKYKTEGLTVHIHHGSRKLTDPYQAAEYDVIITSYTSLVVEYPEDSNGGHTCFNSMIFHRVILDEAHSIKNKQTRSAKACYRIDATHRWCLTATPIQNKLEELFSLIFFLRIRPYNDWTTFREEIIKPMKTPSSELSKRVMKKVQLILKAIALRRSKKAMIDGRPILNLPERTINFTHVDFEPEERRFYNFVDNRIQNQFDQYVRAGTVMQNYSSVLVLLLRLRQACLHPSLTLIDKPVLKNNEDQQIESAESLDHQVVDRLVNDKENLQTAECPICMDSAEEARIIANCGHILCQECLLTYVNTNSGYGGQKTCPQCRGVLDMDKTVPVSIFIKIHLPDLNQTEKKEEQQALEDLVEMQPGFESSKKIDTMLEILQKTREESQGQDKTIIFSQFTSMLDVMERPLEMNGYKFGRYDGSLPLSKRTAVLEQFHSDPTMEVLIVSTKCGSLGLNLTCANRVIIMDIWWNPALENQAIDRVHRIGQTKDVIVHRLFVNDTVEDRILELQRKKQKIADGAMGEGGAEKLGRLDLQDMLYLFRGNRSGRDP